LIVSINGGCSTPTEGQCGNRQHSGTIAKIQHRFAF
jgi:hypothetical protein